MPTVVPSQIVQFIDAALPYFKGTVPQGIQLHPSACGALNALLALIGQLPNSLLPSDPKTFSEFVQSQESIRFAVKKARGQTSLSDMQSGPPWLQADGGGKPTQVQIIRDALAACPDEVPPRHNQELLFINPPSFRNSLLVDLTATRSSLTNGEWKAATVLAGSLAETLLLWAIQQDASRIQSACSAALAAGKLQKRPSTDPLGWGLHQFVEVAEQLDLIQAATASQTRLAKDFRNLIHPGLEIRTQQSCDRGTALATNAAVELILRDLNVRFHR